MAHRYDTVIFCDFDRTITTEETFVGALQSVCSRESLEECFGKYSRGELSLRVCVETLFARVPSQRYALIEAYAQTASIREGFSDLLDTARALRIPFVVISGGIRRMQKNLLEPYMDRIEALYSCDLDLSGEYMNFACEYGSEEENVSKEYVMSLYDCRQKICIGDSFTDFKMADRSDIVFARDDLIAHMRKSGRPFYSWERFGEIAGRLKELASPPG